MISFKDRAFCGSKKHKPGCTRQLTPDLQKEADVWWGKPGAPIDFQNFCDEEKERVVKT